MSDMLIFVAMIAFTLVNFWVGIMGKAYRPLSRHTFYRHMREMYESQDRVIAALDKCTLIVQLLYEDIHRDIPPCQHGEEHARHSQEIRDITSVTEL